MNDQQQYCAQPAWNSCTYTRQPIADKNKTPKKSQRLKAET